MMKLKSKAGALLLSAVMIGTAATTPVQAASSVSGSIEGTACTGSVSYAYAPGGASNGILAKTTFSRGGSSLKVRATVYYKVNGYPKKAEASNSASAGGVTAIARTNDSGNVYGGTGWHQVKSGAYTWERTTNIGTTW